jgi:anti-sigma B factor antagonist
MTDPDDLHVDRETTEGATILRPVGDIDLSRAPSLRTHLADALRSSPPRLIIDLGQVPYIDSSGVATFVEALQVAQKSGSQLVLCALQERVQAVFEIARLDMVFTILATADEAQTG